jgi:cysteine-rich repeat protein
MSRGLATFAFLATPGALAGPAHAEPLPRGSEYAINDRTPAPAGWWTSCSHADGRTATVEEADCKDPGCDDERVHLYLQRRDANAVPYGQRVRLNELPAWRHRYRVVCSPGGSVAAQWVEAGCYRQRGFDASNAATGAVVQASPDDCRTRASLAMRDDGTMLATWPAAVPDAGIRIFARSFAAGGGATDVVELSDSAAGSGTQPKIAVDADGLALVVWLGSAGVPGPHDLASPVFGLFLTAAGIADGAVLRIDQFGYGENSDPSVAVLQAGEFEAAWNNPLEGGRVARRIGGSGGGKTAAGELVVFDPKFGAARVVDSLRGSLGYETRAEFGGGSAWSISDEYASRWRSGDDSALWSGMERDLRGRASVAATDGDWLRVLADEASDSLVVSRSEEEGATRTENDETIPLPDGDLLALRVAGTASRFVASWISIDDGAANTRIGFARSSDGGNSWSAPQTLALGGDQGRGGFDLETDATGTVWIALVVDSGLRFVRSADGGASWTIGETVAAGARCDVCAGAWRHTQAGLAYGSGKRWRAVFSASRYRTDLYGRDGEVFTTLSDDNGKTWSDPVPVASAAKTDGVTDFAPSIASDGSGRWITAWISHRSLVAGDGLDSDVVYAVVVDNASQWSRPRAMQGSMSRDTESEDRVSLASSGDGRWMATWAAVDFRTAGIDVDRAAATLMVSVADAICGNSAQEIGETCDDGNTENGDGCDANCTPTGCPNGIVGSAEECDDGNHRDDDACTNSCALPACGDGILSPWEDCDDGNVENDDACPSNCGAPRCGDGARQPPLEDCDDGGRSTATCTPVCRTARCGDGYLAPRVEACDDGNTIDDDACPNDCSKAVCGDGVTSLGWEECDPADPLYANACTDKCILVGICGDANGDGSVTTNDARRVLQRAVDLPVDCPRRACDMDISGHISAIDASLDLRKAVGIAVGDRCSIGSGTIVFWIDETRDIASFQIDIDYSSTGGEFAGSGGSVACVSELDDGVRFLSAFNDQEDIDVLTAGLITRDSLGGRMDLFHCEFEMPEERAGTHFAIRVVDAADASGDALDPPPLVGYRVE